MVRLESFFDELDDILRFLEFPEENIEEMVRVANLHNAKTWEKNETENHVHFTSENPERHKYIEAMYEEGFVNKTVSYLRYALGYTSNTSDAFPMFANERWIFFLEPAWCRVSLCNTRFGDVWLQTLVNAVEVVVIL